MKSFKLVSPQTLAFALATPWIATSCQTECVAPSPSDLASMESILDTGCVNPNSPTEPAEGVFRYTVAHTFWSDGADKDRWFSVPDGTKMTMHEDGQWELPVGAVTIKHFRERGKLFETRFYVRDAENSFHGYTYEWNDTETDALLVPAGGKSGVNIGTTINNWDYPSRSQCNFCHNASENHFLGFQTRQLNVDADDPTGQFQGNQLDLMDDAGILQSQRSNGELTDGIGGFVPQAPYSADPNSPGWSIDDVVAAGPEALEHEARSYLAVNCGYCHNDNAFGMFDASYDTLLDDSRMCDQVSNNRQVNGVLLDDPNELRLNPGSPTTSRILQRQSSRDALSDEPSFQMPLIGSNAPDILGGTNLLNQWILRMDNQCRDQLNR